MNKCQSVWEKQTENKLHELKPDFKVSRYTLEILAGIQNIILVN